MTLLDFNTIHEPGLYQDLMREFEAHGHNVFIISPVERRKGRHAEIIHEGKTIILKLKIGNIQKTNIIEKGISTISIEPIFIAGIKRYFSEVTFDLVLYSTPPITFCNAVRYVKKRDNAKTYLLLKDIFPQNAVDLGMMSKTGFKSVIYRFFRRKERLLYELSDKIGCMSQANVDYVLSPNPSVTEDKVEICPNSIAAQNYRLTDEEKRCMREQYGIPTDKTVFVYGGNLGKPQDVPFIVECLRACAHIAECFFVIAGSGTDRHFLEAYAETEKPSHLKLFGQIPKNEYDKMIACCDVGLIFLNHRFTIPNFPSRLLSYMQAGIPVLACTDRNTDIGKVIVDGGFGWWCQSNTPQQFVSRINHILEPNFLDRSDDTAIKAMGKKSRAFLEQNYLSQNCYNIIMKAQN